MHWQYRSFTAGLSWLDDVMTAFCWQWGQVTRMEEKPPQVLRDYSKITRKLRSFRRNMMNEHVFLYYRLLCLKAEAEKRFFLQLHFYTLAMTERDPKWKP
jgi:hypothetical protein